ncbi:hypothetical protein EDD11_007049 [Mortierella claussenii]|nr:hypothetical protein EDD11_007049 [Mortierella claussenii]
MPSPARPPVHSQLSSVASQGPGPLIDPTFTAPDFDVKAWINTALNNSIPTTQTAIHASALSVSSISNIDGGATEPSVKIPGSSNTFDATDPSLDASLDLLQTPALDPVLDDGKSQVDQDVLPPPLSSSSSGISAPSTSQQQQSSTVNASKTQNALMTQHATNHLTKLHMLASQTSSALTATTQDMVKLLPRLTHELDQLRQETRSLQEGIQLVRSDVNSVGPSDTEQALDRLKYLDLVKTRMEATHSALREAENWRNLEAEANDILAKGDFTRAAMRLSEAERSLVVYKNTNVEGDRMALLLQLKNQLEQQIISKVKEALEQKDTATCQTLTNVFALIGRQEKFQEYYIAQRRAPLIQQWKKMIEAVNITTVASQGSMTDSKDFLSVLQGFYKDAANMLRDEFAWITTIFVDPVATIYNLVQDIFLHIDPNMQVALQQVGKTLGDEGSLPVWIAAFEATESFGTTMERIVSQPLVGNQREFSGNRPRASTLVQEGSSKDRKSTHIPRPSFGLDSTEIGSLHDSHEWAYILYDPYMVYQRDYGKLEAAHLRSLLSKSVPSMATYGDNTVRSRELAKNSSNLVKIMTNTNNVAFLLAEGAIGRCMRLTHGFGAAGLLDGLNGFFKDIMDRYAEILSECRQKSGLQVDGLLNNVSQRHDNDRNTRLTSRYDAAQDDEDEDSDGWEEDVNEQDQRLFQMGLRLMVLCRQLCIKLEQLDLKTKRALRGVEDLVNSDRTGKDYGSQGPHHHSSTATSVPDHASSSSSLKLTVQPPNASIALLQQSNLNSFRLSEILEIVKTSAKEDHSAGAGIASDGAVERLLAETELGLEPKANHLFLQSHQRAAHLTKLCQRFIFDSVYIPLARPLSDLALLPCWTEDIAQQGQGDEQRGARRVHQSTMGGTRTDVIKFRSSPSDYMEELLRQLLGLPLTFGMYEGDAGLRFGIHALPYTDRPSDASHRQNLEEGLPTTGEATVGKDDSNDLGVGEADTASLEKSQEAEEDEMIAEEDDLAVMHRWITSLSRAAMHTIVDRLYNPNLGQARDSASSSIMNTPPLAQRSRLQGSSSPSMASSGGQITKHASRERHYLTRLSEAGIKQLEMDLGYFVDTCLGSLAIEPTPSIRALIKALRLNETGLLMALQHMRQHKEELQSTVSGVAGGRPRKSSIASESHHGSLAIPGAPVLPSILVVAEDDALGHIELEQTVLEWVGKLRGIDVPST